MKTHWTAVAPVKSIARDGLERAAIAGFVLLPTFGALVLAGGIMTNEPAMSVLGAGCVGIFLAGGASVFLQMMRILSPPAPTLSVIDGRPATVLRREPVAFNLGLVVMAVMGATSLGWAYLATGPSMPWAVILGALGLWMFVPTLLAASGRFNAGYLALTPDGIDYRSRGLSLWVGWDDIGALGTDWPMIVGVSTRNGNPVRSSKTAGWFTGEKLLTAEYAVLRTDAMSVHEDQLAPVLWRYVMTPAARNELGTPASLPQFTPVPDKADVPPDHEDKPSHPRIPPSPPLSAAEQLSTTDSSLPSGRTQWGRRGGKGTGGTSSELPPGRIY